MLLLVTARNWGVQRWGDLWGIMFSAPFMRITLMIQNWTWSTDRQIADLISLHFVRYYIKDIAVSQAATEVSQVAS
jgi:hypothetical protein